MKFNILILLTLIMMPLFINMACADPFRGDMLDKSITLRSGIDVTANGGDTDLDLSASTGDIKAPSGGIIGDITGDIAGNVTGDLTGDVTGNVTGDLTGDVTGNVTGDLTGDVTGNVTGDLTGDVTGNVTGDLTGDVTGNVTGDLTGDVTGNVTGDLTGDVTGNVTGDLTGDVTGNVTGDLTGDVTGNVISSVNATLTINTTLTSINTNVIYPIDASGASKALILPDAATVTGRTYMITTIADPGTYNITITATGGDTIGTAASLATTTPAGLTLISDGTRYGVVGSYGTWT